MYWRFRSDSRLKHAEDGIKTLVLTIDSIDHSKFAFPRSAAMGSKTFDTFIRPTLACTCVIAHGYGFFLYVSEPHVKHDSSWSSDLLSHAINAVAINFPDLDLRYTHVKVHGDNSSKELKNNSCCRLLGSLCLARRIHSGEMNTLQSGHSHEDIDQCFSQLARFLDAQPELHVPQDFLDALQRFVDAPNFRSLEPLKCVLRVDNTRFWNLGELIKRVIFL